MRLIYLAVIMFVLPFIGCRGGEGSVQPIPNEALDAQGGFRRVKLGAKCQDLLNSWPETANCKRRQSVTLKDRKILRNIDNLKLPLDNILVSCRYGSIQHITVSFDRYGFRTGGGSWKPQPGDRTPIDVLREAFGPPDTMAPPSNLVWLGQNIRLEADVYWRYSAVRGSALDEQIKRDAEAQKASCLL
jgi:hypothetical protein